MASKIRRLPSPDELARVQDFTEWVQDIEAESKAQGNVRLFEEFETPLGPVYMASLGRNRIRVMCGDTPVVGMSVKDRLAIEPILREALK